MLHCSALAALAMHGLWGVQCAAELLNNVHGEAGGRRGCEVPEFQLAGTGGSLVVGMGMMVVSPRGREEGREGVWRGWLVHERRGGECLETEGKGEDRDLICQVLRVGGFMVQVGRYVHGGICGLGICICTIYSSSIVSCLRFPGKSVLQLGLGLILLHHRVGYDAALDLACCCFGHVVCEVYLYPHQQSITLRKGR
jgi:hypothetical protein